VHPEVLNAYLDGDLHLEIRPERELRGELAGLQAEEAAVLTMLRARLKRIADPGLRARLAKSAQANSTSGRAARSADAHSQAPPSS
jgi:DNA topoisomerase-1